MIIVISILLSINSFGNNQKKKIDKLNISQEKAIKIAERLAKKNDYDINYKTKDSYIKRFTLFAEDKRNLLGFICYTLKGKSKEETSKCLNQLFKAKKDQFKSYNNQKFWIIFYTTEFNSPNKFNLRTFTVIINSQTGVIWRSLVSK